MRERMGLPPADAGGRLLEALKQRRGSADFPAVLTGAIGGACAGLILRSAPGEWWIKAIGAAVVCAAWMALGLRLSGLAERPRPRR